MKTVLNFSKHIEFELPVEFQGDDNRFPESFVRYFLDEYTKKGDVVFDPFAGYGTTLRIAEEMGRNGYGAECNKKKGDFIKSTLKKPDNLIIGDSLQLSRFDLPVLDFSITSPLYMSKACANPFHTKRTKETEYDQYLEDMKSVYSQISCKLKDGGRVVIEVANLKNVSGITTLAWDIAGAISEVLIFEGEIIINWEESYGYGYDHSYALVFVKK